MFLSESIQNLGWANLTIGQDATLLEFAATIGTPVPDSFGSMNRFLVAKRHAVARHNTTSRVYGLNDFPLHTDCAHLDIPPRYLLLRSFLGQSSAVTKLINPLITLGDVWEDVIKRATWRINSGLKSRACTMHILHTTHGFRWDPHLMRPLNKFSALASTEFIHSLHNCKNVHAHVWESSQQALLIDNWHVLHGRADVAETEHRCIERVYLKEIDHV